MKTKRIRIKVKKYLECNGPKSTTEIMEHVNNASKHGTTTQQIGNVLSKDKDIIKCEPTRRGGRISGTYKVCQWKVVDGWND